MRRYDLYHEDNRVNGCVAVEYTACAENEKQVKKLAKDAGYDIEGYTIEDVGKDRPSWWQTDNRPWIHGEW